MKTSNAWMTGFVFGVVLFLLGVIGWGLNIVSIASSNEITGMLVIRVIGVFIAPLGAILGFI